MTMQTNPLINSEMISKNSYTVTMQLRNPITTELFSAKHNVLGLKSLDYSDTLTFSTVRNHSIMPMGRTSGSYDTNETQMVVYKVEWDNIIQYLARTLDPTGGLPIPLPPIPGISNPMGIYRTPWNLHVTMVDINSGYIKSDILHSCRITGVASPTPGADSTDASEVTISFKPWVIERDGVLPAPLSITNFNV